MAAINRPSESFIMRPSVSLAVPPAMMVAAPAVKESKKGRSIVEDFFIIFSSGS
jgi:hypothetical protein